MKMRRVFQGDSFAHFMLEHGTMQLERLERVAFLSIRAHGANIHMRLLEVGSNVHGADRDERRVKRNPTLHGRAEFSLENFTNANETIFHRVMG